jgi:asparagine synthase (glutamine-hydrolysing)
MCGLAYYNVGKNEEIHKDIAKRVLQDLARRGPDCQKYHINSQSGGHFFHTRLAICDLSANGEQPMLSQDNDITVIFNGEIYNHLELRRLHFDHEFKWRSNCDTETLVELLAKYGFRETLVMLDGAFAIVAHDRKSNKTLFARDYFGEKPLYYHISDDVKIASSRLETFRILQFKAEIDHESIREFIDYGYIAAPSTIYRQIRKLAAGEYIIICHSDNEKIETGFINNFLNVFDKKTIKNKKFAEIDLLSKLMKQIKIRLIGDTSIGLFLSSGMDSNIVGGLCQRLGYNFKKTYTFKSDNLEYDESRFVVQNYVQEIDNAEQVHADQKAYLDALKIASDIYTEPFADSSFLPTIILSKFASKDLKVVLGGDGGDEMFLGYKRYTAALWWDTFTKYRVAFVIKPISKLFLYFLNLPPIAKCFNERLSANLRKLFRVFSSKTPLEAYIQITRGSLPDKNHLLDTDNLHSRRDLPNSSKHLSAIKTFRYLDLRYFLPDMVLHKSDGASMYHGLELRSPLLSKTLFEELTQYPLEMFMTYSKLKLPLHKLLNKLDLNNVARKKRGFTPPLSDILRTTFRHEILRFCNEEHLLKQNLFKVPETLSTINNFLLYKNDYSDFVWRFLVLQLWMERVQSSES